MVAVVSYCHSYDLFLTPMNPQKEEKQKWLRIDVEDGWQVIIPDFDSKPHANIKIKEAEMELAWLDCPCKPKIDVGDQIIVHNSFIDMERINKSMDAFNGVVHTYENPAEFNQ